MNTLNPNILTAKRLLPSTQPSTTASATVVAAMSPPKQMKFKAPPNRKKVETSEPMVVEVPQNSNVDLRIKQAMNHAVAEANQDGCTANLKAFESPFGNYLLPVIPTRAQLDG